MFKRIHLIVLDSVGIGEAPDATTFDDSKSDTLGHISEKFDLKIPNMEELGLGIIPREQPLKNIQIPDLLKGYATKLEEVSKGKDTMTGHWEIAGLNIQTPFRVFPEGFPKELLEKIAAFANREIIYAANKPYSGTEVINVFGEEQMKSGKLIIYTSADPVMQIAAHEEIIPLEELYRICEYARSITLDDPYMIGRIIARPYVGEPNNFTRTANRHDYALSPFGETILDSLKKAGKTVYAVGKINDIFNGKGITNTVRSKDNTDGVNQLLKVMKTDFQGLSFTNLVDFDALYGHRRDVIGYGKAINAFDERIPELLEALKEEDLLMITADHGNDLTFTGTDHTREYVPLLVYSKRFKKSGALPVGHYADISATIAENFSVVPTENGKSFLKELK